MESKQIISELEVIKGAKTIEMAQMLADILIINLLKEVD